MKGMRMRFPGIGRFAVAWVTGLLLVGATAALRAAPAVSWEPHGAGVYAVRGTTSTISLTLTASDHLPAVDFRVSPSLARILSVAPRALPGIPKGTPINLTLTIAPPASTALGPVEGAIQVRNASDPRRNYGTTLGVRVVIDPFSLPPDPGEPGTRTLEGFDINGDGVRDDVERYIAYAYPEFSQEPTRLALAQYVIPLSQALVDASDEDKAMKHWKAIQRSRECLNYLHGIDGARRARDLLRPIFLNTSARSRAYLEWDAQIGGHVLTISTVDLPSSCDVDPNGGAL